jgi:hypothetical protein
MTGRSSRRSTGKITSWNDSRSRSSTRAEFAAQSRSSTGDSSGTPTTSRTSSPTFPSVEVAVGTTRLAAGFGGKGAQASQRSSADVGAIGYADSTRSNHLRPGCE